MNTPPDDRPVRVLVADDDVHILRCYQRAFADPATSRDETTLASLADELFGEGGESLPQARFEVVSCSQGEDAVQEFAKASGEREPFDAVILDIRMPPGINGLEAGKRMRRLDPDVPIVFVSGYSDVPREELLQSVPPPSRVHYFSKPLSFGNLAQQVVEIVRAARDL